VIDEQTLGEGNLEKYKTIILPNFACVRETELDVLRDYVRSGGNIVASYETSLYRTDLDRRSDFDLSDVFGLVLEKDIYDFQTASYISHDGNTAAFTEIKSTLLPAPSWGLEIRPISATPCAYFHAPIHEQYQPIPPRTTPAIVFNRYGKGKCIYLAGNFGEHFNVYGIPEYPKIIGNVLDDLSPSIVRTQNLPETVELTLRTQQDAGRLLVHLINFTGTMRRPISEVVQIHGATLEIPKSTLHAVGVRRLSRISSLRTEASVPYVETATSLVVTIPLLSEYEVLLLSD
jgi:hypothetical protein